MNTLEHAFRIAIEKQLGTENRKTESSMLHPLNLLKMIKNKEGNETSPGVQEFPVNTEEVSMKLKNRTSDISG
jgi:hypothetical protein